MRLNPFPRGVVVSIALLSACIGCASDEKEDRGFFTSGSREADQRAEQRIARDQQLAGGGAEKVNKVAGKKQGGAGPGADVAEGKRTLYERLGGEEGIGRIVDNFVARAMADPRVNWERKGMVQGGWYRRNKPIEWQVTDEKVAAMKKHIGQFIAVATGGPTHYDGRDMKQVHAGLRISNAEFDATIGDLKATLDMLNVPVDEQKELLAVIESTRPQVATER